MRSAPPSQLVITTSGDRQRSFSATPTLIGALISHLLYLLLLSITPFVFYVLLHRISYRKISFPLHPHDSTRNSSKTVIEVKYTFHSLDNYSHSTKPLTIVVLANDITICSATAKFELDSHLIFSSFYHSTRNSSKRGN